MAFSKSLDDLLSESLVTLTTRTGITSIDEDSISRLLIELPLKEITEAFEKLDERDKQFKLSSAGTFGLDWIGDLLGIERKTSIVGKTSEVGMKFYISGTADSDYEIPEGTTVWDPNSAGHIYYTTRTVSIPTGGTFALTGIRSPYSGESGAQIGVLTSHNGNPSIKCINLESIAGTSEERDAQYQYRLMDGRLGRNALLSDAIRTKLLSHPAVIDCRILPRKRGNGTIDAVVYTAESIPKKETIDNVLEFMKKLVADGISVKIYVPTPVIVDLTVKASFVQRNESQLTSEQARQLAQTNLTNFLNTLDLGDTLYPDDIDRIVLNTSGNITDMYIAEMYVNGELVPVDVITVGEMQRIIAGRIKVI